ncbi:MAG TPA: metal-dependent hydrolase [Polyangia bacterium]|nr:metal-dependent hydrolase [Polyangia bacterium]
MASIGHVAVGLAAARLAGKPTLHDFVAWSALSLLPDADVIGFAFGVPYASQFGHRGAAHSLVVALVAGAIIGAVARRARLGVGAALVLASHGLLDTLTDGGLGVALAWPFTAQRWFAPWRPLPVAPIGVRLFGAYGLHVMAVELAWFAPLVVYGLWPRRRSTM